MSGEVSLTRVELVRGILQEVDRAQRILRISCIVLEDLLDSKPGGHVNVQSLSANEPVDIFQARGGGQ